jgi:CBS domain-containing protein
MSRFAMPVRDLMSAPAISVRPETSLRDVTATFEHRDISSVPVTDASGKLVGIVTMTDLLAEAHVETTGAAAILRITPPARTAGDLMRTRVHTVYPETPVRDAAKTMIDHRIHRVIVVEKEKPVGVLSTRDVMRLVHRYRIETPLSRYMTTPVTAIDLGATIDEAIERLDRANVHGVVVVDGNVPVGVFTQTESLKARNLPGPIRRTPVEQVMSYEILCLELSTPIYRAAGHAAAMGVRRVFAVEGRELRGILTCYDLTRAVLEN